MKIFRVVLVGFGVAVACWWVVWGGLAGHPIMGVVPLAWATIGIALITEVKWRSWGVALLVVGLGYGVGLWLAYIALSMMPPYL